MSESSKPTVFFSHSSKDEIPLRKLKEVLSAKLGNDVDIFLSSDGQSIPLGRNWVYEIQGALDRCRAVFIFLSPNAVRSGWVHFEAGYTYARKIKVIPVGVLGFDLSQLSPPLSLLQGFNITSTETLNNIVAIVNEVCGSNFDPLFTAADYANIFSVTALEPNSILGTLTDTVDNLQYSISCDGLSYKDLIKEVLKARGVPCRNHADYYETYGLTIIPTKQNLTFNIEPDLTKVTFPVVDEITQLAQDRKAGVRLTITLNSSIGRLFERRKLTARLFNSEISIFGETGFKFRDLTFDFGTSMSQLDREYYVLLQIESASSTLSKVPIYDLLHTLFELGIIYETVGS